tara:strand:- start:198 stop:608 length:411 start_codon:yes stop_codon:yes gene_type:complete
MLNGTLTPLSSFVTDAIKDGYCFECSCGELFKSPEYAMSCRKCRNYCVFGWCTHVVDVRTGEVVAGEEPSAEEFEVARAEAEARWAEEKAELDLWVQMQRGEGELYEAEMQRLDYEAQLDLEDQHYAIQDKLMGVA